MAAFEHELDALFASGGLTADQAASRAGGASPTVRRRVAELDVAIAQSDAAKLALVPVVSGKLSYTRLSHIDPVELFGQPIPSLDNAYLAEAQLVVPLSATPS
jgi:outer membrane protein TolC